MNNKAELELLDKVKQGLAEQCDKLPEETLGRLQVMRRGALSEAAVLPRFLIKLYGECLSHRYPPHFLPACWAWCYS